MFRLLAKMPGSGTKVYNGFTTYGQVSNCMNSMPQGLFYTIEKNVDGVWKAKW